MRTSTYGVLGILGAAGAATSNFWPDTEHHRALYFAVAGVLAAATPFLITLGERYESERRAVVIKELFRPYFDEIRAGDPEARVNVMLCDIIGPWSKGNHTFLPWIPRRGLTMTEPQGFESDPDLHLSLSRRQGVVGVALARNGWAFGVRTRVNDVHESYVFTKDKPPVVGIDRGMTVKQRELTNHISFVCTFPIRALGRSTDADDAGRVKPLGKIIGVLNLHSRVLDPYLQPNEAQDSGWQRTTLFSRLFDVILPDLASVAGYVYG